MANISIFKNFNLLSVCDEAPGICAHLLTLFSLLLIIVTLPFSLLMVVKVVQVKKTISKNLIQGHKVMRKTLDKF